MLKISPFYNAARLLDMKGWLLQVKISSFANKFNLSDLYMWLLYLSKISWALIGWKVCNISHVMIIGQETVQHLSRDLMFVVSDKMTQTKYLFF